MLRVIGAAAICALVLFVQEAGAGDASGLNSDGISRLPLGQAASSGGPPATIDCPSAPDGTQLWEEEGDSRGAVQGSGGAFFARCVYFDLTRPPRGLNGIPVEVLVEFGDLSERDWSCARGEDLEVDPGRTLATAYSGEINARVTASVFVAPADEFVAGIAPGIFAQLRGRAESCGEPPPEPEPTPADDEEFPVCSAPGDETGFHAVPPRSAGRALPVAFGERATQQETVPCCVVGGMATDHFGRPVQSARVELAYGVEKKLAALTDERGRYAFPDLTSRLGEFDAAADPVQVALYLREELRGGPGAAELVPGRFEVDYRTRGDGKSDLQHTARIRSDSFTVAGKTDAECMRNFNAAFIDPTYIPVAPPVIDDWRKAAFIYTETDIALTVAQVYTGIEPAWGSPLNVIAWCDDAALGCQAEQRLSSGELVPYGAFFQGGRIADACADNDANQPYLAINEANVTHLADGSRFTLAHELGHYVHTVIGGNRRPYHACVTEGNHWGYYLNKSSTDSYVEAIAHFFAYLVMRDSARPNPQIYRSADNAPLIRDLDRGNPRAWENVGTDHHEEWAIASVLVDLVDRDADTKGRVDPLVSPVQDSIRLVRDREGSVITGWIGNDSGSSQNVSVEVEFGGPGGDSLMAVMEDGEPFGTGVIPDGGSGEFWLPVPDHHAGKPYVVRALVDGGLAIADDDPFAKTPQEVFGAIGRYSAGPDGARARPIPSASGQACPEPPRITRALSPERYPGVMNVSELYDALQQAFGTDSSDADALDRMFIKHGLHADDGGGLRQADGRWGPLNPALANNERHDDCEEVGLTSHANAYPRFEAPAPLQERVTLSAGGVDVRMLVYVEYPEPDAPSSYGYISGAAEDGRFTAGFPPPSSGATVHLVALADGYEPQTLAHITAQDFHEQASTTDGPFLAYEAVMEPASSSAPLPGPAGAAADDDEGGLRDMMGWIAVAAGAALVAVSVRPWALVRRARSSR